MKGYIYKFQNNLNGKIYIGQTRRDLKIRYLEHLRAKDNYPIHSALKKYGIDNFDFDILAIVESETLEDLVEQLNTKEIYYINFYNSLVPNGYNIERGGNGHIITRDKLTKDVVSNFIVGLPIDLDCSPKAKLLYLILKLFSIDNISLVSYETIMKYINISIPTIRNRIKELESIGCLKIIKSGNLNYYQFIDRGIEEELFTEEFLDRKDLSPLTKSYIVAIQQYLYKDVEGQGKTSFSNNKISNIINMPESSIRKCEKELINKNFLEVLDNNSRDLQTGCKTKTKVFRLNELGQAIIWKLQDHEERIQNNTDDIDQLRIEFNKYKEETNKLITAQQKKIDELEASKKKELIC